ncbi:hypothetical protein BGE01nite_55140 [Brevifollis gellanilyticus]|uniref:Uncharacterized protein n=1 Tax=Brevifollis gellanilyticus TaxID=748831 RepID=A0A512MHK7_9BACT|nr:hypothetical protein BGE01nite_55140 [Brevifollis gellanilyticus]
MMSIVLEKACRFPEARDYMREAVEQFPVIRGAQDDYVALMKERLHSLKA